ncbi:dihydrofolate reductase [Catalinimonas alkaloidigena]|uniref:dihydrofolate reductase family protein n=1 Tax=Catalinimonas alkaloidigena TaxID=1075417 RepID=UPI002404D8AE|nr:dihydrofolate reductase family protein [Catalinimonas alkaloidigena]MDF9800998.1 dihydrofolate reductase [Catalinimonas alkaloidigena]
MDRQLILYIAMSLDGYIAKDDDNIDFLFIVEWPGEDYGYAAFQQQVDTLIWGRKTYDKMLSFGIEFPHKDKRCIVLSRTKKGSDENVEFFSGDLKALITELKQEEGKNIYCDGGGELVYALLKDALIDKMIISIIPHLLGSGVRLFKDGRPEQHLKFTHSATYPSGLVQLWYEKHDKQDEASAAPKQERA